MTVLTEKELAEKLNLSQWTVRRMRLQEGMPYFAIGKRIYYQLEKIFEWIEFKQTETVKSNSSIEEGPQYGKIRQII